LSSESTISPLLHAVQIKQELLPIIKANQERTGTDTDATNLNLSAIDETTATAAVNGSSSKSKSSSSENILEFLVDIREHDVPYYIRCSIDLELRVGAWYSVEPETGVVNVTQLKVMQSDVV
jgi:DNA polymerase epsilon subunit 1